MNKKQQNEINYIKERIELEKLEKYYNSPKEKQAKRDIESILKIVKKVGLKNEIFNE